jgi:hypothetical protein
MFGEGLNVRLAISGGETATLSGQMSIKLHKRIHGHLQAQTLRASGYEREAIRSGVMPGLVPGIQ